MPIKKFVQRQLEQTPKPSGQTRKVSLHLSEEDRDRAEKLRQALGMKSVKELLETLVIEGLTEAEEAVQISRKK